MDQRQSLPVEFLFALRLELGTLVPIEGGPQGNRLIADVVGGTFEGPRLRGRLEPPGGDWLTRRPDGTGRIDVRSTLRTDDGVPILMTYSGISRPTESGRSIRTALLFETGDPRYAWLNTVQAVGVGRSTVSYDGSGGRTVSYDVYVLQ
jgi:hypothetical protein